MCTNDTIVNFSTVKTENEILYTVTGVDTKGYPAVYNVWAKSPEEAELKASDLGMATIWHSYPCENDIEIDDYYPVDDDIPNEENE